MFAKKNIKARLYCPYNNNVVKKLQNVEHKEYNPHTGFISVDAKEMLFLVSNEAAPDYEVAIWVNSPFFVNAVDVLFEASFK